MTSQTGSENVSVPIAQPRVDAMDDIRARIDFANVVEHHRARLDLIDRIGDALVRIVGDRTVHWLEPLLGIVVGPLLHRSRRPPPELPRSHPELECQDLERRVLCHW